jgi:hypothetical protein
MRFTLFFAFLSFFMSSYGQKTSITKSKGDSNLVFTGTRAIERDDEYDSTGHFSLGGYISTYYAGYSDTSGTDSYQKFPTSAPKKETFGLNIVQFSLKYRSEKFRGNSTLQYGDIPQAAWSPNYNNIQEANIGFRIIKHLWLDAGFFRTHIGLESIQPRENMALSIAVATYYEPYYLSGAKLSYTALSKLTFQINAFNSFNGYVESNKNKALGASVVYDPNDKTNITYNFITCDESQAGDGKHQRYYNNLVMSYRSSSWTVGFDFNYAIQKHQGLKDTSRTISMFSALMAIKYRIVRNVSIYGRISYFSDPDEMLTGPIENANHEYVGLDLLGTTFGFEFKPIPNSYFRLEGRLLQTSKDESIFHPWQGNDHQRVEVISGIGLWF